MYRYETHLHTMETSRCGYVKAADQVRRYKEMGYDGICVTDHLHDLYIELMDCHDDWQACCDRYMYGYKLAKAEGDKIGLDVIFGIELRFPENDSDYLIYGVDEKWLRSHPFICHMNHKDFFDTYGKEVLIIHAHPYRHCDEVFWDSVHGIEIVNCNPRHDSRNELALELAMKHPEFIRTVGSDAHKKEDQGRSAVLFPQRVTDSYEFKRALESGDFSLECDEFSYILQRSEQDRKSGGNEMKEFDTMIIGQVCMDTNTDWDGRVEKRCGGAVLFSGNAAASIGRKVAVVTRENPEDLNTPEIFKDAKNVTVFDTYSKGTTLMENTYFTQDRERRLQRSPVSIDPYTASDLPEAGSRIYHLAGLVTGDIPGEMIEECAKRGDVALDVQCMLRAVESDKTLKLYDWPDKKKYLPLIRFFKTDAAEAEILTGLTDRDEAARLMCSWGAKEVMITHNTEVIVCDGEKIYRAPLKPRNLTGRTGRGDTCFAGYITERLDKDIPGALEFAAALVSLKMETPGPFTGTRADVEKYIAQFYR